MESGKRKYGQSFGLFLSYFNDIFFFSIVLGGTLLSELTHHIDKSKLFVKQEKL